ncbi:MAG TPA: class I SAM-dependent methyltransferase [Paucimonas sp.]|nr:class I SAM-dependent methyltransferase [Paucimonas sp.]HJW54828.1 class I SAM-dependent methyltransferase [Burkholderiaceae bacterium]
MSLLLRNVARPVWMLLPPAVRTSSLALWLKAKLVKPPIPIAAPVPPPDPVVSVAPVAPRAPFKGPQQVSTLEELDEMLVMLDAAAAISDDELRRGFTRFTMRFPLDLPADPDSEAYRTTQFKLYEWLHGKPYSTSNEVSSFDTRAAASRPFPFYTESPHTVGNHIISIGHLIRTLNLPPKSAILEFGPGWGNTTVWLARMGYRVTAVDIEQNFVDLIRERARRKELDIDVRQGDFSLIDQFEQQFDAVLFFECFHHCANHQALIASLDRVIAPGGKAVFAAEPITDDFPIPWGLRLDGESLWAIRKQGWLELGFKESYFRKLLARHGWEVEKSVCPETPWGVILTATRKAEQAA